MYIVRQKISQIRFETTPSGVFIVRSALCFFQWHAPLYKSNGIEESLILIWITDVDLSIDRAFGKKAVMKSSFRNSTAMMGIDGNTNTCFHTNADTQGDK